MIYRNFNHHSPDNSLEKNEERQREIHVLDLGLYSNLGSSFSRVCTLDFKHKDKRKMENSFNALPDNEFKNNKRKRRHKGKVRGREERGKERGGEKENSRFCKNI